MTITGKEDWLVLEQIILSGQMPESDLAGRLAEDKPFADWLKARADARQANDQQQSERS